MNKLPLEDRMMKVIEDERMMREEFQRRHNGGDIINAPLVLFCFIPENTSLYIHYNLTKEQYFTAWKIAISYE